MLITDCRCVPGEVPVGLANTVRDAAVILYDKQRRR